MKKAHKVNNVQCTDHKMEVEAPADELAWNVSPDCWECCGDVYLQFVWKLGKLGKNDWWVGEGIDLVSIFIWFAWAAAWMSCQGPPTHHIHPSWPPISSWAAWMNRYVHPSIPSFLLGAHLLRREGVFFVYNRVPLIRPT